MRVADPRAVDERTASAPISPDHVALGNAIRLLRRERGISQEGLALEAGLHRTYVGGVERGERNPSYTNIVKLARALDVRAWELLAQAETSGARRLQTRD